MTSSRVFEKGDRALLAAYPALGHGRIEIPIDRIECPRFVRADLPRLSLAFNRKDAGRLRVMVNDINAA